MRQLTKHDVNKLTARELKNMLPFEITSDGETIAAVYEMPHKQVLMPVKGSGESEGECVINGIPMAMVDEVICDLVRYLNAIPEIQTIHSCQHFPDERGDYFATVSMILHGDIIAVAKSIFDAVRNTKAAEAGYDIRVKIEYMNFDNNPNVPTVSLDFPTECIKEVTDSIKKLAYDVNKLQPKLEPSPKLAHDVNELPLSKKKQAEGRLSSM